MNKCKWIVLLAIILLIGSGASLYSAASTGDEPVTIEDTRPKIALTFDDGPHPVYTERLLDGLGERDVKATFFVIGRNIEGNETVLARMSKEGHLIGNHTYDHVKVTELSAEEACQQMVMTSELVAEITGQQTEYVRPPFGAWDETLECGIEMFPVMWTIDPRDWTTKNVDAIVESVVSKAAEGGIILMHDWYGTSVDAALRIVDLLQAEGYEFVTVDEMILE